MSSIRTRALACYRNLHRSLKQVFRDDQFALNAGRIRINEEFRKNLKVTDTMAINDLIRSGEETATYLRTCVVQTKLNEHDAYEVQITKDTALQTNWPYLGGDCGPTASVGPKAKRERKQRTKNTGEEDSKPCSSS